MLIPAPSAVNARAVVINETSKRRLELTSGSGQSLVDLASDPGPAAHCDQLALAMSSHVNRERFSKRPSLMPIADSELCMSVSTFTSGVSALSTLPMPNSASLAHDERKQLVRGNVEQLDPDVRVDRPGILRGHGAAMQMLLRLIPPW